MRKVCTICQGTFLPKKAKLEKRCLACRFFNTKEYPKDISPLGDIPFEYYKEEDNDWCFNIIRDLDPPTQDDELMDDDLKKQIDKILLSLNPREQKATRLRFGLLEDRSDRTLEEIGDILSVTKERARHIGLSAISKLQHPKVERNLKNYVEM